MYNNKTNMDIKPAFKAEKSTNPTTEILARDGINFQDMLMSYQNLRELELLADNSPKTLEEAKTALKGYRRAVLARDYNEFYPPEKNIYKKRLRGFNYNRMKGTTTLEKAIEKIESNNGDGILVVKKAKEDPFYEKEKFYHLMEFKDGNLFAVTGGRYPKTSLTLAEIKEIRKAYDKWTFEDKEKREKENIPKADPDYFGYIYL